jgi:3-dehydroquinate dehydratase type I
MIAVPIVAETVEGAISSIRQANREADVIELRLDFLREVNETILKELLSECKKPTIVAFRNKNHGASVETQERMFLLLKAVEFNADYIDLDFDSELGFLHEIALRRGNTRIILSHHDCSGTPPLDSLLRLLKAMLAVREADVLKIVTFANSESDNGTILGLVHAAKKIAGKPLIAFCMGAKGIKSRIACVKMGSMLTFASLGRGKESAPGQMPVWKAREELEK